MTNINNSHELVKDEAQATSKSIFSSDYSAAEKETLATLFKDFFRETPSPLVSEMWKQFFDALIQTESMGNQKCREDLLSVYNNTNRLIEGVRQWEATKKDELLLDLALDYLSINFLEDANVWVQDMFEAHYTSYFLDDIDAETRYDILYSYLGLLKFNSGLIEWHKKHRHSKR